MSGFVAGSGQQARCGRDEAGSVCLVLCYSLAVSRIHLHELHGSTLHSFFCVSLTVLPSLHTIRTRVCLLHVVW